MASPVFTLSDWKDIVTIFGTLIAVIGGLIAASKTLMEFRRSREQRELESQQRSLDAQRKRVEFTLAQHRRLFDDPVLFSVLQKLDDNHPDLASDEMWDAKRKFLTFFEELYLLMQSELIERNTALYIFSYYAVFAKSSSNFNIRIEYIPQYWGLFMLFSDEAEEYLKKFDPVSLKTLHL